MTVPCVPPVVVVSKAARAAWRLRHPFRPAKHAAVKVSGAAPAPVASPPPASGCEGLVAPEGGRFLPALPGGKPAALAAAAGAGSFATGAALGGASGGSSGGGSGGSGSPGGGFGSGGFGGGMGGATPLSLAQTVASRGFDSAAGPLPGLAVGAPGANAGTLVPDAPVVRASDNAAPVPAPGVTALFAAATMLVVALRWFRLTGAAPAPYLPERAATRLR